MCMVISSTCVLRCFAPSSYRTEGIAVSFRTLYRFYQRRLAVTSLASWRILGLALNPFSRRFDEIISSLQRHRQIIDRRTAHVDRLEVRKQWALAERNCTMVDEERGRQDGEREAARVARANVEQRWRDQQLGWLSTIIDTRATLIHNELDVQTSSSIASSQQATNLCISALRDTPLLEPGNGFYSLLCLRNGAPPEAAAE